MLTCWLPIPNDTGHGETLACWLPHCQVTWMIVRNLKEVQEPSTAEAKRQKWYYNRKANSILLEPGDLVLAKANVYKGKRKVNDWWEGELYKVVCQAIEGIPSYLMKNKQTGCSIVLHWNLLFLIAPGKGTPLCMVLQAEQTRCAFTTLEEKISGRSETEKVPQSVDCMPPVQHQTVEAPLGWLIGKLCAVLKKSSRASMLEKGWRVQCRGPRSVWASMPAYLWQRYWSHWWSLWDMAG